MFNEKVDDTVFFSDETKYKIGKTTYIVKSHYDEDAEYLVDKIKKLLKSDIQRENVEKCRFFGIDMI